MQSIISLICLILLISGCATKSIESRALDPQRIRQCYVLTNMQLLIAQDYIAGNDYSMLYAKYVDNPSNKPLEKFLIHDIKRIIKQNPKNAHDYVASIYSSCVKANGRTVKEKNVKMCFAITSLTKSAMRFKHLDKTKEEAISIISKPFQANSIQYMYAQYTTEKWYSEKDQTISNYLYSEFNQCMQITELKSSDT